MTDEYPFDLGTYTRPVTTQSAQCQAWFDRGLVWSYAFNHEEAAECFRHAIAHDSTCAMAYWGLAYCIGPNYNKPWAFFDADELARVVRQGHDAALQAQSHLGAVTPVERALVAAVLSRYPQAKPDADCEPWNLAFAQAMQAVHAQFPDDLDVITVYVDAVMNLHPWDMWQLKTGEPTPGAQTLEMRAILDRALGLSDTTAASATSVDAGAPPRGGAKHPGLLHLYIHLLEMSPHPEHGLPAADNLRTLVPDAGHLLHMPSHLDILTGAYAAAAEANTRAAAADERYLAHAGPLNFYTLYRSHDYHFLVYAALFSGQSALALDACRRLEASLPAALLRIPSPPMADRLEAFLALRPHVLVRFGRWHDILALPTMPDPPSAPPANPDADEYEEDASLLCVTNATRLYAKALAHAALGNTSRARTTQGPLPGRPPPRPGLAHPSSKTRPPDLLAVAARNARGRDLLPREPSRLRRRPSCGSPRPSTLPDALPYKEPWVWMQPVRHAQGALLLERRRAAEALAAYAADLGIDDHGAERLPRALQHPGNVWALHGYHESLVRLGRSDEARAVEGTLNALLTVADVDITSSCFCRRVTAQDCAACRD
ncbi:TPR domain-containing protein [Verticillium alfalfae VaMs.102]|uniref:TPR domain-containing protein n=1 Tax=Verticillium alfalfae (strain VaMs.102 / ATCC MYA-4576 / FGSC 10136) TaxID=526221 RepID=C9SRL3_VERA1|nr:TPR domain-containing protein [Verticillium alfalfae VaMs.102]EEY21428.1 TPR domain-containing protein [Verticillium alfalfae VaMs.102]